MLSRPAKNVFWEQHVELELVRPAAVGDLWMVMGGFDGEEGRGRTCKVRWEAKGRGVLVKLTESFESGQSFRQSLSPSHPR